jgi:sugar phosphate isomerase/epimerase
MKLDFTRRGFLSSAITGAGMAGMAAVGPSANVSIPGPETPDIKLGVASYSLREFQRGLAIKIIQQLNVSNVSIKEYHLPYRSTPEELRQGVAEFEKAGIKIVGGGVIYLTKDDDDEIRRSFNYAKQCGMPLMVIGPTAKTIRRIEGFVKEYNIPVAIHNHGPEDEHFPSPEVALKTVRDMDPRVGLCIDVGHTVRTGTNPVDSIRAAGSRLLDMHIKDLRNPKDMNTQVPVGDGALPIVEIFKQLKTMNYQGCVNLEYEIDADNPLLGMAKSFSYMRGVLAGLRG